MVGAPSSQWIACSAARNGGGGRPLNWVVRRHANQMTGKHSDGFRLRGWPGVRRNFLIYSVLAFGLPFWLMSVYFLRTAERIREPAYWLILLVAGLGAGYVWGLCMWEFLERKLKQRREASARDV